MKTVGNIFCLLVFSFVLSACGRPGSSGNSNVSFSNDNELAETVTPYVDEFSQAKISFSQTYNPNQEFKVKYKTFSPDGEGNIEVKARSLKEVPSVAGRAPNEGKKLVLVEISVKGNPKNQGNPSSFNQVGEHPSPQFVLADSKANRNYVEETYYSDAYTVDKKLFELSKITLDHDQWVHTAIVFEINKDLVPDLAFRFTNLEGKTEFYDIK